MKLDENNSFFSGRDSSGDKDDNNEKFKKIEFSMEDSENLGDESEEDFFDEDDLADDSCPIVNFLEDLILISQETKPLGVTWTNDDIKDYLEKRGYRILKRYDKSLDLNYELALKPGEKIPKDSDPEKFRYSPQMVFDQDCRDISKRFMLKISKWLDKDGKEETGESGIS